MAHTLPNVILQYIAEAREIPVEKEIKLPPMDELAVKMGVSRGKLREELIAAQAYGIVEMRPGDGTYVRPFDFYAAVGTMILYGIARNRSLFDQIYQLRVQLEAAFWNQAVHRLTAEDHTQLQQILRRAEQKLHGSPVEIPHDEHRQFHLQLFSRLDNEFVVGILKAYWDAYEMVGLNRYFDYLYFEKMWNSHKAIVEAILGERYDEGKALLIQHFTLLQDRLQDSLQSKY